MKTLNRPLDAFEFGCAGGALMAGIEDTYRSAVHCDGRRESRAGVFSSEAVHNRDCHVVLEATPGCWRGNAAKTAAIPKGIGTAAIMACEAVNAPASLPFTEQGIDVSRDGPPTSALGAKLELQVGVRRHKSVLALTHQYSGIAKVRETRVRITAGEISKLRTVQIEHARPLGVAAGEQQGVRRRAWLEKFAVVRGVGHAVRRGRPWTSASQLHHQMEAEHVAGDLSTLLPKNIGEDDVLVPMCLHQGMHGMP